MAKKKTRTSKGKTKYVQKFSIVDQLMKKDKELKGSNSLLGKTAMTFPSYNDAMRTNMNTTHLNQCLTLVNPDFPLVFTNAENLVGKNSGAYKKVKNKSRVYRKVVKYEKIVAHPNVYTLFLFDEKEKKFNVVARNDAEDLTENFGYLYDNTIIDQLSEGDKIPKGTVLYKSTSYDENMNYCFGKNVITQYVSDPRTYEDSAAISESLSKSIVSIESERIFIGLNDNDFLLNLYGEHGNITDSVDPNEYYKPLPDVGTIVDGNLIASRRLFKNQTLYDFKQESLNEIHDEDDVYSVESGSEVIDYTFYSNNMEREENMFTHQLNRYIRAENKYYKEICKACEEIMSSGYEYSRDIDYLYKRSLEMLDGEKKWKEGDSAFSNIVIEVTVRKFCNLSVGQKIAGRYGNKSVISSIVPDEKMPVTTDGRRVDLLLNTCAIVNRTTAFPLYEMALNSLTYKIRERMRGMKTLRQKEEIFFRVLEIFNQKQYQVFWKSYSALDEKEKENFIQNVIDDGIYLHQPPLWEEEPIFYRIQRLKSEFPWGFGDTYTVLLENGERVLGFNETCIGEMYILKLKQTDRRGFSARNTGAINIKGLPTRSYKSRAHLERTSETPIRFGEYESLNFMIGLYPEDLAAFHALYRTSVKGRRDLVKLMFKNPDKDDYLEVIDDTYDNRVNEIFNVILKSLSIQVDFIDKDDIIYPMTYQEWYLHSFNDVDIMCTDYEYYLLERIQDAKEAYLEEHPICNTVELEEYLSNYAKENDLLMDKKSTLKETLGDLFKLLE